MSEEPGSADRRAAGEPPPDAVLELIASVARRASVAGRLEPPGGAAVLRSVVEATVALFDAEAASIALHDATSDRLVYVVAAGEHGQGVVGLSVAPHEGVAGYVFSTGQPIAMTDVASDPRFAASTAEQTGYIPRSLLATPLVDDDASLGVLSILDKRTGDGFGLRDVELAGIFARQATTAIRATRLERDTAGILAEALRTLAADGADEAALEELVGRAMRGIAAADDPLWTLADRVARLRDADPGAVTLLAELLDVLIRRTEAQRGAGRSGSRPGPFRA